jgi:hypothetical protein
MSASATAPFIDHQIEDQVSFTTPDQEAIARLAYSIWETRMLNGIPGTSEEDWYQAEQELDAAR